MSVPTFSLCKASLPSLKEVTSSFRPVSISISYRWNWEPDKICFRKQSPSDFDDSDDECMTPPSACEQHKTKCFYFILMEQN